MLKWEVLYILSVENQFQVESPCWFSEASHPRFQVTLQALSLHLPYMPAPDPALGSHPYPHLAPFIHRSY